MITADNSSVICGLAVWPSEALKRSDINKAFSPELHEYTSKGEVQNRAH